MVGVRPFGLRCEEEGGWLERREETEGEERRVEVWMRRWDFRVVTGGFVSKFVMKGGAGGNWLTFGFEGFDLVVEW